VDAVAVAAVAAAAVAVADATVAAVAAAAVAAVAVAVAPERHPLRSRKETTCFKTPVAKCWNTENEFYLCFSKCI
jgi:hypothetical protein